MSSLYTPNKLNNPTSVTLPVDGDTPIKVSDVRPAIEGVFDSVAFGNERLRRITIAELIAITTPTDGMIRYAGSALGARIFEFVSTAVGSNSEWVRIPTDGTAGRWVAIGYRTVNTFKTVDFALIRSCSNVEAWSNLPTAKWPLVADILVDQYRGIKFATANNAGTTRLHVVLDLTQHLPPGALLKHVSLLLRGGGAHAGLPAVMPRAALVMQPRDTDGGRLTLTTAAFVDDTSINAAAYDAFHSIELPCTQNNLVDENNLYQLVVANEASTNALANLTVMAARVNYEVSGEIQ